MSLFDVSEVAVLDMLFGSGSPAQYELGLSTVSSISDSGVGGEPSGSGYARVSIDNDLVTFPGATTVGGVTTSVNGVTFSFAPATGSWGTVRSWFLYDPTNVRNVIHGTLSTPKSVVSGDIFQIPSGTMIITLD